MAPLPPVHAGTRVLGNAGALRGDILGHLTALHHRYGDVVTTPVGPPKLRMNITWLFAPEGAEVLFGSSTYRDFRKEQAFYEQIRVFLGDGILTAQDDDWLRQKRFVQPLFTAARVDGYLDTMTREVQRSVAELGAQVGTGTATVDLSRAMTTLTLRVVGSVLFGEDSTAFEDTVRTHFPVIGEAVRRRGQSPKPIPLSWPLPANRRARGSQAALYATCDRIIADRRSGTLTGDDLATRLIRARDGDEALSDKEVRDQVLIFLLAGHETTSSSLMFALHLLGRHPDVQEAVRREVAAVVGEATPTAAQVHGELPYTTAVLRETMRLYPSAPLIGRLAVADHEICGYDVPAGQPVAAAPWVVHRNARVWDDPLRFDPDRFVEGVGHERHRYAWMPFGGGPRACIGQHFAMLEAVSALALLVRSFEFTAPPGSRDEVPVSATITLQAVEPVLSQVARR